MGKSQLKERRSKPAPKGAPASVKRKQAKRLRKQMNMGKGTLIGNIDTWI